MQLWQFAASYNPSSHSLISVQKLKVGCNSKGKMLTNAFWLTGCILSKSTPAVAPVSPIGVSTRVAIGVKVEAPRSVAFIYVWKQKGSHLAFRHLQ
jgi:hypothetical protein